jgi:hypothetical protein
VKVITQPDGTTIVETGISIDKAEGITVESGNTAPGKSFTLPDGRVVKATTPHEAVMAFRLARESRPGRPEHDPEFWRWAKERMVRRGLLSKSAIGLERPR